MHKTVHASRAARPGSGDVIAKALGEDLLPTASLVATESPRRQE
jgi:hypothetical protein